MFWLWLTLVAAPSSVHTFWPCTPGQSITYQVIKGGKDTQIRITETVRGPKAPRLCVVDRVVNRPNSKPEADAFALELLEDRIAYAGFADSPTAFRPPLLKAPLERGASWTFNRVGYKVQEVGTTFDTPAGTFEGCVRISEADIKGHEHEGYVVYAPELGPIIKVNGGTRLVAERVARAPQPAVKSPETKQP